MSHLFSTILLQVGGICIQLAKCQFPFGQQQQWYPAQNQWVVPSWQQQQQPVIVQQQQPWHHHHHHDDHHHHPPPPPIIVHHDHHDDHHHHVAHYAPIRNNGNAGDGNANNVNQQSVIPYRQEQFSPLGFDLTEATEGVGSTPSEFQEQLPELYKTPTFIEQPQTVQQQPNLSSSGNVNNEFVAHNNNKQQQHRVAVSNSRPTTTANGGGGAVQATQRHQQMPGNNRNNNNNNNVGIGGTGPRRRITTAAVRLPAGGGGATAATNPALVLNNNGNNNKLGTNGNGIQHQQQLRKLLLLTGPTTTTSTTPATTTTTAGSAIGKTKLVATKRPAVGPPAFAPPKIGPHSQAVPAKQPIESAISREFDLPPPPPPSRFLPDVEKLRIDELLRQKVTAHQRHDVDSENFQFDEFTKFSTISSTISSSISETTPPPITVTVTTTETTVRPTITTTVTSTLARLTAATAANAAAKPTPKNPNESFLSCCRAKRVPKSCESRCNFDVLSKKILTALFLNTDKCPSENGLELFTCAAQDSDHTDCCKGKKVQRTSAGNKCLAFCNLSPDAPRVQADASYLPCWAVLNEIKNCFRDKLTANLHI